MTPALLSCGSGEERRPSRRTPACADVTRLDWTSASTNSTARLRRSSGCKPSSKRYWARRGCSRAAPPSTSARPASGNCAGGPCRGRSTPSKPKPPGRPSKTTTFDAQRVAELERLLAEKELELKQALVREEVALILPRVAEAGKKTSRASVKLSNRKPR